MSTITVPGTITSFTPGDIVVSISGDISGGDAYGDNQASPMTLEEITPTGSVVGIMVMPQTTEVVNGVTEYPASLEFGSSSEGSLQLSADGHSLVIMGYGVSATAFNAGGVAIYGNTALAQSTSIPGGEYTAVPRVVVDISATGSINTSTAIYDIDNTNNPRSVATVNGTVFYIAGQGVKGDTTQGLFVAYDGANAATAITTASDVRTAEIVNGELYVSEDSTQVGGGGILNFGTALPLGADAGTHLPGIGPTVVITATNGDGINSAGETVYLSPENYFFASPTVLYVSDGGIPKEGGVGDGGLQKWELINNVWTLEYTVTEGLPLVDNSSTAGATGLIGLTGTVVDNVATLYATNTTINDLDPTYLFTVTDTLTATTDAGDDFTTLLSGIAGSYNIRGVAFAPTPETTPVVSSTTIASGFTSSGITINSGSTLIVQNGGTVTGATILSGGTAVISGTDISDYIAQGAIETVLGSASGDYIGGIQIVSNGSAVVSNEVVVNGGSLDLFLKGAIANAPTVETGGTLNISGNATATATVLQGGLIDLESPKAVLGGTLTFAQPSTIEVTSMTSAGYGGLAVISGWAAGDVIDETLIPNGATLTTSTNSAGNTVATIASGTVTESFIFAGTVVAPTLQLVSDGGTGVELSYLAPPVTNVTISAGTSSSGVAVYNAGSLEVFGTLVGGTVLSGGSATIESGGTDSASTISAGGYEMVLGTANADQIFGTQVVSAATAIVNDETVYNGGAIDLFLKGAISNGAVISSGGELNISGNATAAATVLEAGGTISLQSPKADILNTITFVGGGTIDVTGATSAGYGVLATISGFGNGAVIDEPNIATGATLTCVVSGGNTVATLTSGSVTSNFTFAGTTLAGGLVLTPDATGGVEIVTGTPTSSSTSSGSGTSSGGGTSGDTIVISGGTVSSTLSIASGFTLDVLAGGTVTATTLAAGATGTIAAGGVDSATVITGGGSEAIAGSGTGDQIAGSLSVTGAVSAEIIANGGSVVIQTGGMDTGSTILAGGSELVLNGTVSADQVYGTQQTSSGVAAVLDNEIVYNGGVVNVANSTQANGLVVSGGGVLNISGNATAYATVLQGGTLDLQSPKATINNGLTFAAGGELLVTGNTSAGYGDLTVISGFAAGDTIDISSVTSVGHAGTVATVTYTTSGGVTSAVVSGGSETDTFIFAGTTISGNLSLGSDGAGGVELTYVTCYGRGTRIATPDGETAIEYLREGDLVLTAGGRAAPVKWIGYRHLDCSRHPSPRKGWPVRVKAGAFGEAMPKRDLLLSPQHAIFDEGVLVPVKCLINGMNVVQEPVAVVEYFHVELDRHDIVLAESLPAESYLDTGDRGTFQNAGVPVDLYPDMAALTWEAMGAAELKVVGPEVDSIRAKLASRAPVAARQAA